VKDIVVLAVVGSLVALLVPETQGDAYRKLIALITALGILCVLGTPLRDTIERIRDFPEQAEKIFGAGSETEEAIWRDSEAWVIRRGTQNAETGIETMLCARFYLNREEVEVELKLREETGTAAVLDFAKIMLSPDAACTLTEVKNYAENLLACPCRAEYFPEYSEP